MALTWVLFLFSLTTISLPILFSSRTLNTIHMLTTSKIISLSQISSFILYNDKKKIKEEGNAKGEKSS